MHMHMHMYAGYVPSFPAVPSWKVVSTKLSPSRDCCIDCEVGGTSLILGCKILYCGICGWPKINVEVAVSIIYSTLGPDKVLFKMEP